MSGSSGLRGKPITVLSRHLKGTLLESVPPGVTTWTVPVVAPAGTVAVMNVLELKVKVAGVPLRECR